MTARRAFHRIGDVFTRIPPRWQFATFIVAVLAVALALTALSYTLYIVSGTAQLDLSRPEYKGALREVAPVDTDNYTFAGTGPLTAATLKDFSQKYTALVAKTKGYDAFDPAALSDESLGLTTTGLTGPQ